jgi:hypothetical protein
MYKNFTLTESEREQILNQHKKHGYKKLLNEQGYRFIKHFIGNSIDDFIKKFGDDGAQRVESLLAKGLGSPANFITKNGKTFILSKSGTELPLETFNAALKSVADGKHTMDEIIQYLPRQLADGTEFRSVFSTVKPKAQSSVAAVSGGLPLTRLGQDFKTMAANRAWVQVTDVKGNMSGWKFHVYADTLDEVAFLYEKLLPVVNKYGAGFKLGGGEILSKLATNAVQKGKGVTIYLPSKTVANKMVDDFISDLQSATNSYKKTGSISGDKMITKNIGYRYELSQPIDTKMGVDLTQYTRLYSANQGGAHNIPNNPDLFP